MVIPLHHAQPYINIYIHQTRDELYIRHLQQQTLWTVHMFTIRIWYMPYVYGTIAYARIKRIKDPRDLRKP